MRAKQVTTEREEVTLQLLTVQLVMYIFSPQLFLCLSHKYKHVLLQLSQLRKCPWAKRTICWLRFQQLLVLTRSCSRPGTEVRWIVSCAMTIYTLHVSAPTIPHKDLWLPNIDALKVLQKQKVMFWSFAFWTREETKQSVGPPLRPCCLLKAIQGGVGRTNNLAPQCGCQHGGQSSVTSWPPTSCHQGSPWSPAHRAVAAGGGRGRRFVAACVTPGVPPAARFHPGEWKQRERARLPCQHIPAPSNCSHIPQWKKLADVVGTHHRLKASFWMACWH